MPPGEDAIIIADVLTDIEHEGRFLMYEGKLEEISLGASRDINYVCLISPQRFLLTLEDAKNATSERSTFVAIDRDGRGTSRIVISGSQIKNFLTRTHLIERLAQEGDDASQQEP